MKALWWVIFIATTLAFAIFIIVAGGTVADKMIFRLAAIIIWIGYAILMMKLAKNIREAENRWEIFNGKDEL